MKILLYAVISCLVLSSYVQASDWRYIGQSKRGKQELTFFVDKASIKKTGNIIQCWTKATTSWTGDYAYIMKDYDSTSTSLEEYDCKLKKYRLIQDNDTPTSWHLIPPDSIAEAFWDTVCNNKFDY